MDSDGTSENSPVSAESFSGQLQVNAARMSHFLDGETWRIFASSIAVNGRPWDIKVL